VKEEKSRLYRLIIIGKKQLPAYGQSPVEFAFVEAIYKDSEEVSEMLGEQHYTTKTRGGRILFAARLIAEGTYAIVKSDSNSYFVYKLGQPKKLKKPQEEINLGHQGHWIVSVKNPEISSEKGLSSKQKADFPKELLDPFQNRKFIPLHSPEYLNYPGAEFLFISRNSRVGEEWGRAIKDILESLQHQEFNSLFFRRDKPIPSKPLSGEWE
jgi:hypothetical protein